MQSSPPTVVGQYSNVVYAPVTGGRRKTPCRKNRDLTKLCPPWFTYLSRRSLLLFCTILNQLTCGKQLSLESAL